MQTLDDLLHHLQRLDGKGYKAYKDIAGTYDAGDFELWIDHVQGDPFAAPSRVRVRREHGFPGWTYENGSRAVALCDFLTRQVHASIPRHAQAGRGSGKSGLIGIDRPGQEVLERSSVVLDAPWVEARLTVGLPAFGRRIAGRQARALFGEELPAVVRDGLFWRALDARALRDHLLLNEDADVLRDQLAERGLIAFVANGALLPRASGVDPRPLKGGVPFQSPPSMSVEIELPNRTVAGMGIPDGVTLIVGGGYHGKSTLLNALQLGVYNHVPGDGRELVVARRDAVKIRAEDGRSVEKVDISAFIGKLPQGKDTRHFRTPNASGSTSQAANLVEAIEAGADTLLIDEDTSATNFMIRDRRMQQLVPQEREPITPFIERVRSLYDQLGVSSVIVVGGSGMYFDVADQVICMVDYKPLDLTEQAKAIAAADVRAATHQAAGPVGPFAPRRPRAKSVDPQKGKRVKIRARGRRHLQFGEADIDVSALEQLVHDSQLNAIGDALYYARRYMDDCPMPEVIDAVLRDIEADSLDVLGPHKVGNYAAFRRQELAAVLNRLRTLRME